METFLIQEALAKGIRNTPHNLRNSQRLVTLRGGKAMPYAIVPFEAPTNPLAAWMASAGITVSPPFPQFVRTTLGTLLLTATSIYLIDETAWTGALQPVVDFYEQASGHPYTIASSGKWSVSDAQGLLVIQNGLNFIIYKGGTFYGITGFASATGCYHYQQGRVLLGGFSNTAKAFYSEQWQAVERLVSTKASSVSLIGALTSPRPAAAPSSATEVVRDANGRLVIKR